MNLTNTSSLLEDLKFSFIAGASLFIFIFFSISTFAALHKNTPAANGGLTGGAFIYWMEQILIPDSLPNNGDVYEVGQKMKYPTVKNTRRLADANGNVIATGYDGETGIGKIGIGTTTPSELLEIQGDTPRVLIDSSAQNPELKVIAKEGNGKIYFDKTENELVFQKSNTEVLSVNTSGEAVSKKEVKENGVTIVRGNQRCSNGTFVKGFDEQGNIQCN